MLLLISIVILSVGAIFCAAEVCYNGVSPTGCVCGYMPNSTLGYGQVIIGGSPPIIISCNNIGNSYCPEDFQDAATGLVGNCGNCPDPDCTATVQGTVRDGSGKPIDKVLVTGHPIKWNASASLDRSANLTSGSGFYSSSTFLTGTYYFGASKDAYDTQLIEATVVRGSVTTLNFNLQNGTCHEDCTNSYNRCNKQCDGVTFDNGTKQCKFYYDTVKKLCDTKMKGTEVFLRTISINTSEFITCCGDGADVPYTKYYKTASAGSTNVKNLIKTEKIAKYNGVPVRIVIAYWR